MNAIICAVPTISIPTTRSIEIVKKGGGGAKKGMKLNWNFLMRGRHEGQTNQPSILGVYIWIFSESTHFGKPRKGTSSFPPHINEIGVISNQSVLHVCCNTLVIFF